MMEKEIADKFCFGWEFCHRRNKVNNRELAIAVLAWEKKKRELDDLEQIIKQEVLERGESQTVGNVRVTYRNGRKSYDYEFAGKQAPVEVIGQFTTEETVIKTDWRAICKHAGIIAPFSEGSPSVSIKLLD